MSETLTQQQRNDAADSVLAALEKPSRGVGAISAYLQRAIETGAYSEGERLPPERQLAATFKAARSTVRRALDQLEKAGLVSRRLGSGTFVGSTLAAGQRSADLADQVSPLQLIEARLAVEPFTTRLAVLHATRRTLDEMESVLAHAEASTNDKDTFSKWDGEFHLLIARASANPLLLNIYRQINHVRLHAQWDAMKEKILTPDVIADYNRQHRGIFTALHVRDAQLAQTLITEHLEKARDDLVKANSP
ncbi:MAG: FadR/GntR family transcriptional regulator [Methyloceanibacter sp.]|uniref:FadR/GntR family transcriptional regulator n=1 Tax=Methyloceanibacter sp. TaxID=1965321 RepID=UPI003D6D3E64